jgi:pSer/pThr/pTyr-binding forkhead associated (FHA) protein
MAGLKQGLTPPARHRIGATMDVKLTVQKGGKSAQTFRLRAGEMIIGRQKGCGVRVPSGEVSRQHCLLLYQDDLLWVEDLSSANGTFINGRRITRRDVLRPGDKLKVGPVTMLVQYQLSDAAVQRLMHEDEEEIVVAPLDDVEIVDEGADAEVELLLDGNDAPLMMDEQVELVPEGDPLEALRAIEAEASGEPAPPPGKKKKTSGVKKPGSKSDRPRVPDLDEDSPAPPPKRVKLTNLDADIAASADESPEDDDDTAPPDASQILGHKNWQLPTGEDIREILAQIEKGKKKT